METEENPKPNNISPKRVETEPSSYEEKSEMDKEDSPPPKLKRFRDSSVYFEPVPTHPL